MSNFLLNKKFLIFLAILAIGTLLFALLSSQKNLHQLPQITSSNPAADSVEADIFTPIIIQFDKSILADDFSLLSSPKESWILKQDTQNSLVISHSLALHPSTKYDLTFSWKGDPLPTLSFTTHSSQGDPRLVQTLTQELNRDYPLASLTPHEGFGFSVVYSAPLTLEITITNSLVDQADAIAATKDWVKGQGLVSSTHQYIITSPPPTN